jgi:hypothetical protein
MKNIKKYATSNVFFHILDLEEDLKKYGLESFEFDIIQSFPKDTPFAKIYKVEQEIISSSNPAEIYNLDLCRDSRSGVSSFVTREKEAAKMHARYEIALKEYNQIKEDAPRIRLESRAKVKNAYQSWRHGYITATERNSIEEAHRNFTKDFRVLLKAKTQAYLDLVKECKALKKKLQKKYAKVK